MAATAERRLIVTDHAVEQYRERVRPEDQGNRAIREKIKSLVLCGLEAGNVLRHKPEGFRLYGRPKRAAQLPAGQRFVWCEDEPRVAFVLVRNPGEDPVVKTTLVRIGVSR
jgi:hypothetical protein